MQTLEAALEKLGFGRNEAAVYLYLLENPGRTVYQIARDLSLARSTAYPVVAKLFSEGSVLMESSDGHDSYHATEPSALLARIRDRTNETISFLGTELPRATEKPERDIFATVVGRDPAIAKAKEMMKSARTEIYLNTDLDIGLFRNEFSAMSAAGIRVIVFSFNLQSDFPGMIELFSRGMPGYGNSRIMLVVDGESVLLASYNRARDEWVGTTSNNALLTKIVAEHIHHDIYLLEIADKYGRDPFRENPDILLGTLGERMH
jgi:predicted DNA-binding transcriptional regulator